MVIPQRRAGRVGFLGPIGQRLGYILALPRRVDSTTPTGLRHGLPAIVASRATGFRRTCYDGTIERTSPYDPDQVMLKQQRAVEFDKKRHILDV